MVVIKQKKPFKIKVKIPGKTFSKKQIKVRVAMAEIFASSPFLNKKQKTKEIKELFKKRKKR